MHEFHAEIRKPSEIRTRRVKAQFSLLPPPPFPEVLMCWHYMGERLLRTCWTLRRLCLCLFISFKLITVLTADHPGPRETVVGRTGAVRPLLARSAGRPAGDRQ